MIRDIQQYQNVGYSLQPVVELQDYVLSNMQAAGDVHEMYDKSLQIEPREREDEKIVRYGPVPFTRGFVPPGRWRRGETNTSMLPTNESQSTASNTVAYSL